MPKGKSKTLQFQLNKVLVLCLELEYEMYCQIQECIEQLQEKNEAEVHFYENINGF